MRLSIRVLLPLMFLLIIAQVISGCGGGPAPSKGSAPDMSLHVGQISNAIGYFPFYVADKQGFFKAQGLNIGDRPLLGTGAKLAAAIESGSIDVGGGVITDAFNLQKADTTTRVIGSLINSNYVDLIVSKKFMQETHLTVSSSLAEKIQALRGKKIGITGPGSGTEALVTYLFKQQGLDVQKSTELVSLGSSNTAVLGALSAGRVDALSFFSPIGQAAETQGIGTILISPDRGDIPSMQGELHGVFYTRQNVIKAKSQAIQAFIRAIAQAETYIHSNPEQSLALLTTYLQLGPDVAKSAWATLQPILAQSPQISQQAYDTAVQFHMQAGLIKTAPAYDDLISSSTIDSSLQGQSS
jgi:NitT/TauT family transport system substrate-binding protein